MDSLTQPSWVSALQRLVEENATSADVETLQRALAAGKLTLSKVQHGDARVGEAAGAQLQVADQVIQLSPAALERLLRSPYQPSPPPQADVLPQAGGLPPGSRLPFLHNAAFTGRQADLLQLARLLLHDSTAAGPGTAQPGVVITGDGGTGKTCLAVEFCYRYGRYFHAVHWLQASQDFAAGIAACGFKMELLGWPEKQPEQVQATLAAWKSGGVRLVVLDEAEDPQVVLDWLPRLGNVRVLVTTRCSPWPVELRLQPLPLDALPRAESLALLRRLAPRLQDLSDAEIDPVPSRLSDLPVALDLAGRYLNECEHLSPAGYLVELDEANPFRLGWRRLKVYEPVDALAQRLFRISGYCASGVPIPVALLAAAAGILEDEPYHQVEPALQRLCQLGLLTWREGGVSVHPALAAYARQQDRDSVDSVLPQISAALHDLCTSINESGLPWQFLPVRPHLEAALPFVEAANLEQAGWLWNNLGYHLGEVANYEGAQNAFEHALSIVETVYGPHHPNVAILLNNLASVLRARSDLSGVSAAFERALSITEGVYGPHHPNVAILLNHLGGALHDLGDLNGARSAYQRALTVEEAVFGPQHANIAILLNNLGRVLKDLGDLSEACSVIERAIKIDELAFGVDHIKVGQDATSLGLLLKSLGDLSGARSAFEHALAVSEAVFGSNHLNIARDLTNLGYVLHALGDLEATRRVFERALAILERYLPPDDAYARKVRGYLESLE